MKKPREALIAITYRCNNKCYMCNTWQHPTAEASEIRPSDLQSLPDGLAFCNITGGEPFLREDIGEFIGVMSAKAARIVVSTNGYYTDRILRLAKQYPGIGIRVSIEGMAETNDRLRGIQDGFKHGIETLRQLRALGIKDIGFGVTLSDRNITDLMALYQLGKTMDLEFATACVHNTYYFHKYDNAITRLDDFDGEFRKLITALLKSANIKNWFRAYFNYGLLNYVHKNKRLLPCEAGTDIFFMDPLGNIMACNGMEMSMGNIRERPFCEIWNSDKAEKTRLAVKGCCRECWMIGTASPAMKKRLNIPLRWVIKNKIRLAMGKDADIRLPGTL